jgi:hypothetical protein
MGSTIIPLSERFTVCTMRARSSIDMSWCRMPMPRSYNRNPPSAALSKQTVYGTLCSARDKV